MAEEKLRRKIRAEAALDSLSVGPPLAGFKSDYPSLFRSMRCFSAGLIWEGFIFEFRSSW
jgi:hypothetical protein